MSEAPETSTLMLWLILSLAAFARVDDAESSRGGATEARIWQGGPACGPNALYTLLRIHGKHVLYDGLYRYLSPPAEGNSLAELKRAAEHWGLDLAAYQVRPERIESIHTPFIAQITRGSADHFTLVLGVNDGYAQLWDSEGGRLVPVPIHEFNRVWTGYVLATGTDRWTATLWIILTLEVLTIMILASILIAGSRTDAKARVKTL